MRRLLHQMLLLLLPQSLSNYRECCQPGRGRNWTAVFYSQSPLAGYSHHRWRSEGEKKDRWPFFIIQLKRVANLTKQFCAHPRLMNESRLSFVGSPEFQYSNSIEFVVIYCRKFAQLNYNIDSIQASQRERDSTPPTHPLVGIRIRKCLAGV